MVSNGIIDIGYGTVTTEPCTLTEVKNWIKVADSYTDDDTIITALITVARQQLEQHLSISLASKTITCILNNSLGGMELPYGPVTSVTSVTDFDGDTLVVTDEYELIGDTFKRINYPTIDYLKFVYVAGWTALPTLLKQAVMMQVAYLYEHRGDEVDTTGISKDALMLSQSFSRNGIFI